jgi:hypothetical protein
MAGLLARSLTWLGSATLIGFIEDVFEGFAAKQFG